jgi:hypothetical protein
MSAKVANWSLLALVVAVGVGIAGYQNWPSAPKREIQHGEYLDVQALGTLIGQPIAGVRRVDEDGKITLGAAYGRVAVAGLDVDTATAAVIKALKQVVREPEVSIERLGKDALPWIEAENRRLATENALLRSAPRGITSNDH